MTSPTFFRMKSRITRFPTLTTLPSKARALGTRMRTAIRKFSRRTRASAVKGTFHGPDGLSRHPRQPGDALPGPEEDEEVFEDWVD
ncbi:hypothetical protein DXG03_007704, partial [Asterophora parasitica]